MGEIKLSGKVAERHGSSTVPASAAEELGDEMDELQDVSSAFDEDKERSTVTALRATPFWLLPALLSMVAGSMDVVGFLALGGLFPAHITGNLVVLAAHYTTGRFS